MKPDLIFVLYKLDKIFPETLPDIAIDLITKGYENEYLVQIAGLSNPSKEQLGDLVEKGFNDFVETNCDLNKMSLIIAKGIIENEVKPYDGAFLIGEISEKLDKTEELWYFKCQITQYDDYEEDKGIKNLGYDSKNIEIWQSEILTDITIAAKKLVEKYK